MMPSKDSTFKGRNKQLSLKAEFNLSPSFVAEARSALSSLAHREKDYNRIMCVPPACPQRPINCLVDTNESTLRQDPINETQSVLLKQADSPKGSPKLRNKNVNKQRGRKSEKIDSIFPNTSRQSSLLDNSKIRRHVDSSMILTESSAFNDSTLAEREFQNDKEDIVNQRQHSYPHAEQAIDDPSRPRSTMYLPYTTDYTSKKVKRGQTHPSSKDFPQNAAGSLNQARTEDVLLDADMLQDEDSSFCESNVTVTSNRPQIATAKPHQDSTFSELWKPQKQEIGKTVSPTGAPAIPNAQLENDDLIKSFNMRRSEAGMITLHKADPDVVGAAICRDNLPRIFQPTHTTAVSDPAPDFWYDDTVFPTSHSLNTSEDMRAAMKRAKSHAGYKRPTQGAEVNKSNSQASRFGLQTKYRQTMAALHRLSFDQWKAETSARAGLDISPSQIATQTHPSWKKITPLGCPRCLQFNVSTVYGKPCICRHRGPAHEARHTSAKQEETKAGNLINIFSSNDYCTNEMADYLAYSIGLTDEEGVCQRQHPLVEKEEDTMWKNMFLAGQLRKKSTQSPDSLKAWPRVTTRAAGDISGSI